MNILVCGGAGYIGSHMVLLLAERGHEVTVLDNLSSGHREAVLAGRFEHADLSDRAALDPGSRLEHLRCGHALRRLHTGRGIGS
ncbi:MAG: NAD-dependent epimerase/dehydratase family protein [Burkholderiales bacterium]